MRRFALIALLAACTVDDPVEPAEAPAAEAPPTRAEPSAMAAEPVEAPEPPQLSPDVTPVQDLSAALQRLGRLMTEMREAIREAGESTEGDDCAKARAIEERHPDRLPGFRLSQQGGSVRIRAACIDMQAAAAANERS